MNGALAARRLLSCDSFCSEIESGAADHDRCSNVEVAIDPPPDYAPAPAHRSSDKLDRINASLKEIDYALDI